MESGQLTISETHHIRVPLGRGSGPYLSIGLLAVGTPVGTKGVTLVKSVPGTKLLPMVRPWFSYSRLARFAGLFGHAAGWRRERGLVEGL